MGETMGQCWEGLRWNRTSSPGCDDDLGVRPHAAPLILTPHALLFIITTCGHRQGVGGVVPGW